MKQAPRFLAIGLLLLTGGIASGQQYIVKFATVAPEGSAWMNVMREYDAAVRKESGGKIGFKIYPGGVQGDEKGMLRKIRIGQLQSAAFTGVGIGEVAPRVRVVDSPFLFRNVNEVDDVYAKFDKEFQQALDEGGYVLLGWAELGFVYVFTNSPIQKPDDLRGIKMWTWEGDPVAESAFSTLGINPIPLTIDNVLTSLQTGLIDAFYTTPYAAIALQWFTRVKYMVDVPLADASGALLISKKYFETLPNDLQDILIRNGRSHMARLIQLNRLENIKSIEEFKKRGITILKPMEKDITQYIDVGERSRKKLVGRMYPADLLQRIENELADFRKANKGSK